MAVMVGPQLRSWTWGLAMLPLGVATVIALPLLWRRERAPVDLPVLLVGIVAAGWIAIRCSFSPVRELAQADLLLLVSAIGAFVCVRAMQQSPAAERILAAGTALMLLASVAVSCVQLFDKDYSPLFRARIVSFPSGFYGHYNEGANFLIGSSLLTLAFGLFGRAGIVFRVLMCLIALSGFAVVTLSGSRGGQLGAASGIAVFTILAMVVAKRGNSRWFGKLLVALPSLAIIVGLLVYFGWQNRTGGQASTGMLDNDIRLYLMGIAVSCIQMHPWTGGGSRSFAWECYGFWDPKIHGFNNARPELVHNELVQTLTDYGILGLVGLVVLLGVVAFTGIFRVGTDRMNRQPDNTTAWQVGGISAFAGMFMQSNFSFVFHVVPQAILVGICLGFAACVPLGAPGRDSPFKLASSRLLTSAAGAGCAILLLLFGWKGSLVTRALWPVMFSKVAVTAPEDKIAAFTNAATIWPQSSFFQERGLIHQSIASSIGKDWTTSEETKLALEDYAAARRLYPFEPTIIINQANLLSSVGRDAEAEDAYNTVLGLQGGMENAFFGYYHFGIHLLKKGLREFSAGKLEEAASTLRSGCRIIDRSVELIPWAGAKHRLAMHESLGTTLETSGPRNYPQALAEYNATAAMPNGASAHYRASVLLGKMAVQAWSERNPSRALALFLEARRRSGISPHLPEDVTQSEKAEYLAYLKRTIEFLEGAKVTPEKLPGEWIPAE